MNYSPGITDFSETHYTLHTRLKGNRFDRSRNDFNLITEDSNGTIWLGSNLGVARVIEEDNTVSLEFYMDDEEERDRLDQNVVECIIESEGELWTLCRSPSFGLCRYDDEKDQWDRRIVAGSNQKMAQYDLIDLYIDRNNILWLGNGARRAFKTRS